MKKLLALAILLVSFSAVAQEPAKEGSSVPLEILVGVIAINLMFPGAALVSVAWGGQWYVWRTTPSRPSGSPVPGRTQ